MDTIVNTNIYPAKIQNKIKEHNKEHHDSPVSNRQITVTFHTNTYHVTGSGFCLFPRRPRARRTQPAHNNMAAVRAESWRDTCINKWSLKLHESDDTSEDQWQKYYEERNVLEY